MTKDELREKIRLLVPQVVGTVKQAEKAAIEYDELTKFPQLKDTIVDLLTYEFDAFLASIDWVAPKPTTFRINLKNDQEFYLIYNGRSWIAQVEGKKYYLLNLPEEERAIESIARILRYGPPGGADASADAEGGGGEVEVEDEVDVDIDTGEE